MCSQFENIPKPEPGQELLVYPCLDHMLYCQVLLFGPKRVFIQDVVLVLAQDRFHLAYNSITFLLTRYHN